jgi:hypothetical protein
MLLWDVARRRGSGGESIKAGCGEWWCPNSFRPNLSFFDKKMKVCLCANGLELLRLDEQTARA